MATRGFEFAYMIDNSNATPVIRDFTLGEATAYKCGDLVVLQDDGYIDKAAATQNEMTGVMMEDLAVADITAETTKGKVAILTRNQVWRCSMDATSTALVKGYTKTVDIVDCNTLDADGSSGKAILVDTGTDDDGNALAYVVFSDTTFGNA